MADMPTGMPQSPDDWLDFLEPQLDEQVSCTSTFQDYYDGNHRLQMATAKFREAFSRFFPPMANNWMQIVVDAPVSRLTVQGFRFDTGAEDVSAQGVGLQPAPRPGAGNPTNKIGGQTPPWEIDADKDAWDIWQANNMDSISRMLHTDAVKLGKGFALVQPPDSTKPTGKFARITPEHASQCFVYTDPEDRRNRLAALKRWQSDYDGMLYANVYLADGVYKYTARPKSKAENAARIWLPDGSDKTKPDWRPIGMVPNPMGVVPLIPLENDPDLLLGGRSDLEQAIPIQDAINKYCLDMQVSSEFHAFPQRWAIGMARAVDDKGRELSGREVEMYMSAARMLRSESETTKFGQFTQGDVENYLKPIQEYIDHLAAQTQTPLYYLKGKMAAMSADAMHAQDQGLVDRCKGKQLSLSDGWEEVMRTAFLAQRKDDPRGKSFNAETIWADPESKSLAVLVQAAMIMRTQLSVPIEMCWQMLGWSPQQIRLARDLMNLPPGGAISFSALAPDGTLMETPGAPEPNDPSQHPGNQPGQPSGQGGQPPKSQLAQLRASLPVSRDESPG